MLTNFAVAPVKFKNVHSASGGPISEISSKPKQIGFNRNGFEAYAQIRPDLLKSREENFIYGNYTGTGSDELRYIAQYKAISEAVERWAFHESFKHPKYRFDLDPTTSGMAAFPGLFANSARNIGMLEAIERWSLVNWWNGSLPARNLEIFSQSQDYGIVEIMTPWKNISTVILFTKCQSNSRMAYGFAAHKDRSSAIRKAEIELYRNLFLLENVPCTQQEKSLTNKNERRLLYFSSESGYEIFTEVLARSILVKNTETVPDTIVDSELVGPWTKYCTVWRVLYENKFSQQFEDRLDQFLF